MPPEKKKKNDETFVTVYETLNYEEAHIIVGRLQSEDIPALLDGTPNTAGMGIASMMKVRVKAKHLQKAYTLLDDIAGIDDEDGP